MRSEFAQDERFAVAASVGEFPDDDFAAVDEVFEVFVAHRTADELGLARQFVARDAFRAARGDDLEDALLGLFVRVLREGGREGPGEYVAVNMSLRVKSLLGGRGDPIEYDELNMSSW